jgi:transcription initiation factor TFIIF subunit alpha
VPLHLGTKPPRFKPGKAAAVEWQMSRKKSDVGGPHPSLELVSGGKKQKSVYTVGGRTR